jgi:hypothetical protein
MSFDVSLACLCTLLQDKRRLEKLTPAALAQAIVAIQADIEWRRVRALAAALHVDALKQRSKFIGITVQSEAEAYADAVSEPVEKSIEALSSFTASELNDHSSIAAYERDMTSFVTADAEFDEVERFACGHFQLLANNATAD